jgi:hypothetical protein
MPGIPGRVTRPEGTGGNVPLQTRVPEELKKRYDIAAQRRGISLSLYLEELINLDPLAPKASKENPLLTS